MSNSITNREDYIENIIKDVALKIPQSHRDALSSMIDQIKSLNEIIESRDMVIKGLREENNIFSEKISLLEKQEKEVLEAKRSNEALKSNLDFREANISKREMNQDHKEEIFNIRLNAEIEKTAIMKDSLNTIFKPRSIRETAHKSIPVPRGIYNYSYDGQGNQQYHKSGDYVENQEQGSDITKTEE